MRNSAGMRRSREPGPRGGSPILPLDDDGEKDNGGRKVDQEEEEEEKEEVEEERKRKRGRSRSCCGKRACQCN